MGEQSFWETYWFDKIVLPTVLSIVTAIILIYVPKLFLKTRTVFGRRRARNLIGQANALIGCQTQGQGGTAVLMLMTLGHLLIRIAVLLIAAMGTCTFYLISILDKTAGNIGPLVVMAIFSGVLMSMIFNTWNEVSAIALASMGPSKYLDEVGTKLGSIYRGEFQAELAALRTVAEQNQKQQKGMYGIGTIAEGLIFSDRQSTHSSSDPQASNPTETESSAH